MELDKGVVYEVAGAAMSARQQHDKLHNAANNQCCPDNNFFRLEIILFLRWAKLT